MDGGAVWWSGAVGGGADGRTVGDGWPDGAVCGGVDGWMETDDGIGGDGRTVVTVGGRTVAVTVVVVWAGAVSSRCECRRQQTALITAAQIVTAAASSANDGAGALTDGK